MKNIPFLKATHSYLTNITEQDYCETMPLWLGNREVTKYLVRGTYPSHPAALKEQFQALANNREEVQFSIVEAKKNMTIGICGLHRIDWIARHAELRNLIGNVQFWGQGIGTEVNLLLLVYGFEILNMNKIWLGVNAKNKGAHSSYLKAGFVEEGLLRQEVFRAGECFDVIRMSMLRSEYVKLALKNKAMKSILKQIQIGD